MAPRPGPMADVVECIWVARRPDAGGTETVLPSGRAQVVFALDEEYPVAAVVGPATRSRAIDAGAQRFAVGVVLRAGGLRSLTGHAASDFVDATIPVQDVLTLEHTSLLEQLRASSSSEHCVAAVSELVAGQFTSLDRPPSAEVRRAALMLARGHAVAGTAAAVGELPRRLRATFRDEIGMMPKTFARLQRFHAALRLVRSESAHDLAGIAVSCGYADQSHMTRDFGEFAGITPGAVHRDGSTTPTHLDG